MHNPLLDDDGFRIPVTRITFEPLPDGVIRWTAWDGDKLLLAASAHAGRPEEMRKILESTRIIATAASEQPAGRRGPASPANRG